MKYSRTNLTDNYDDVFEEVWLPIGDYKKTDINRLIEQGRIRG